MKKALKRSLSLLLAITIIFGSAYAGLSEVDFDSLFVVEAKAATSGTTGDCTWSLDGTVLTISGNGAMGDYSESDCAPWGTKITRVIIEDEVSKIGARAFFDCTKLTTISIGDNVTKIGGASFANCTSLSSVIIPDSVTHIDIGAFSDCESLKSITIPDSVISIDFVAFARCINLESVELGNNVKDIGEWAFDGCTSLTSLTIPRNLTNMQGYAFRGCTSLEAIDVDLNNSVYRSMDGVMFNKKGTTLVLYPGGKSNASYSIPEGVLYISSEAFGSCKNLTSITIPNSVSNIGYYAFAYCKSLKSITIPDSVVSIDKKAFYNCTSLASITIPDSVTSIGSYAFENCRSLESITIPDSITTVGDNAFDGCTGLVSVTIPDSVTSIGSGAFSACTSLASVAIPDSVTSIGRDAFSACTSLASVAIPDSITTIGDNAFDGCTGLVSVTIPDSVTRIGWDAFYNTGYYNDSSNWQNDVLYIGNHLIKAKKTVSGNYSVRNGTKTIACRAFYGCTSLISLNIPDGVTCLDVYAFSGCTNLAYVIIPNSVTRIDEGVFFGCISLNQTYYCGTKKQWDDIDIEFFNEALLENVIYNYSLTKPTTPKIKVVNTIAGMKVTWNAVEGAAKYVVYRRLGTSSTWSIIATTTGLSFEDKGSLVAGNYYVYSVKAYNSADIASDYIKANCASVQRVIAPVTKAVNAVNGINVTWGKVAGANKYVVLRRLGTGSVWETICTTTSTSYLDKNVTPGIYYLYSIRAVNNTGYSEYDVNKRITIQRVLAPTAVATNLTNGVQITWSKGTGATKYNVYRRTAGSSTWALMGTTTGTSLVDKSVTNGTYYVYSIRAINGTGYSAFDTSKTDTIQPITAPTAKVAKKSNGVQVSWNSVSGATKYNVYRRLGGTSTWVYAGQTTGTSFIDTGVVKGKSYAYSIRAINGTGYSAYNSSKCATIKYS